MTMEELQFDQVVPAGSLTPVATGVTCAICQTSIETEHYDVDGLPVLIVVGSFPSGLITAFIVGLGLRQAWKMTAAAQMTVFGPYRAGAADHAAPA